MPSTPGMLPNLAPGPAPVPKKARGRQTPSGKSLCRLSLETDLAVQEVLLEEASGPGEDFGQRGLEDGGGEPPLH